MAKQLKKRNEIENKITNYLKERDEIDKIIEGLQKSAAVGIIEELHTHLSLNENL
jgi:hypothetical protein